MRRPLKHRRIFRAGAYAVFLALLWPTAAPAKLHPSLPAPQAKLQAILPTSFAGWQAEGKAQESTLPAAADSANATVLEEYGFQQFEAAHYTEPGNTLAIRAIRFHDASGAYGAYSFYRRPNSIPEQIGRGAAWDGAHVLFWTGATIVDATFGRLTAMSAAELRELADGLLKPSGNENIAPTLPRYLPKEGLNEAQTRYTLGPAAYTRSGGVLPPSLVDFRGGSAEAVTASYSTRDGHGELTLLEYPTPQLAEARQQAIAGFLKAGDTPQAAWPQALADSRKDSILLRRSGPIVAVLSGALSPAAGRKLIGQVNYEAGVVWNNPQGYIGEGSKVAHLLIGIAVLVGIIGGASILLGLFLGGGRAAFRILRGKPASTLSEKDDIIRLKLDR